PQSYSAEKNTEPGLHATGQPKVPSCWVSRPSSRAVSSASTAATSWEWEFCPCSSRAKIALILWESPEKKPTTSPASKTVSDRSRMAPLSSTVLTEPLKRSACCFVSTRPPKSITTCMEASCPTCCANCWRPDIQVAPQSLRSASGGPGALYLESGAQG